MNLLCPECCSEEAALVDRGSRLECGNCGAGFVRDEALVSVAEAEAELLPAPPSGELFRLDRERAVAELRQPAGAIAVVSPYSDADELDALAAAAIDASIVARANPHARFYVYPLSLSEPEPLIAVDPGSGPTLLGCSLKLRQREGEDPVEFTLRILDDMVTDANGPVATGYAVTGRPREAPIDAEQAARQAAAAATSGRYALVVVLDAEGPEQAWEALHGLLSGLEGGQEPECVYVGAPWQGIPEGAEDLSTERLTLGMSVPDGEGGFASATAALRPCG